MGAGDLTTLAHVREHLGIDAADSASDGLLSRAIRTWSRHFKSQTSRDIIYGSYTETRDGNGTRAISPRQHPVQAVSSLTVDNVVIPPQAAYVAGDTPPYGWVLADNRIELDSVWRYATPIDDYAAPGATQPATFRRGDANVVIVYTAGYLATGEAATIPAATPYTVQSAELFAGDVSVTFAGGAALAKVTGVPTAGQYAVSSDGLYTFAAADTGKGVLLSYGYVPGDIEQAVIDMVALAFRGRDRIGERSKTLGQENVSFTSGMPDSVQSVIDFYTRRNI